MLATQFPSRRGWGRAAGRSRASTMALRSRGTAGHIDGVGADFRVHRSEVPVARTSGVGEKRRTPYGPRRCVWGCGAAATGYGSDDRANPSVATRRLPGPGLRREAGHFGGRRIACRSRRSALPVSCRLLPDPLVRPRTSAANSCRAPMPWLRPCGTPLLLAALGRGRPVPFARQRTPAGRLVITSCHRNDQAGRVPGSRPPPFPSRTARRSSLA